MTARWITADVFDGLKTLEDGSVDLVITSPPFLALRSYLPADHPDKGKEIGSEPTPAAFIDVMLAVTAELRRVLAPHGSICIELGDTYAGPQPPFRYTEEHSPDKPMATGEWINNKIGEHNITGRVGEGWPLAKSKTLIPELYRLALAYGINPLTGQESPAGRWRVRNVVTWCRPNPPVGALGDKWRPATSDIVIACTSDKRYWDDIATRRPVQHPGQSRTRDARFRTKITNGSDLNQTDATDDNHAAGAPLLDYWELPSNDALCPSCSHEWRHHDPDDGKCDHYPGGDHCDPHEVVAAFARWGLDRFIATEGRSAPLLDYWELPPGGYPGSHYAVYPPALVEPLIKAMAPPKVCETCGEPSRRIVSEPEYVKLQETSNPSARGLTNGVNAPGADPTVVHGRASKIQHTLGWSDCGHDNWRPAHILDPFAGSGTTLSVATGHGHTATGIDLDPRNKDLALERIGPFLFEEATA